MTTLLAICEFCASEVLSDEEWFMKNKLLFCDTCCKAFSPSRYKKIELKEKFRYDNDEYKTELVNDYIETDSWTISGEEE